MSTNTWIALGILGLAVGALVYGVVKSGTKEERRRAKAIAEASGPSHVPLKPEEQELADAWHEDVQEYRTGELPKYVDAPRRPTVREVARKYRHKPSHSAKRLPKSKSAPKTALDGPLPRELAMPVMLPGPIPTTDIADFTGEWQAATFNGRKVGAR